MEKVEAFLSGKGTFALTQAIVIPKEILSSKLFCFLPKCGFIFMGNIFILQYLAIIPQKRIYDSFNIGGDLGSLVSKYVLVSYPKSMASNNKKFLVDFNGIWIKVLVP